MRTCEFAKVQVELATDEGREWRQLTPIRSTTTSGKCASYDISSFQEVCTNEKCKTRNKELLDRD